MAVVTTYGLIGVQTTIAGNVQRIPDLFGPVDNSPPITPVEKSSEFYGLVSDNTPIAELEESSIGWRAPTFLDDYYFRIHVMPGQLVLGNLLSSQVRNVEVWNAYLDDNLLSSLGEAGTDGLTLQQPHLPPTLFAALESRVYVLNISTNGPPVVDATYTFNFQNEQPTLKVTGRRVVLWPFIPETGHTETLEWKTDMLNSFNNEQRLALRTEPRQAFQYKFILDPYQFSRAKAISTQWAHRVYGIAVWSEMSLLRGIAAGATFIEFDTSSADYRDDDLIILWKDDLDLIALEITTVEANGVNLKLPLETEWGQCYIAPLRFARTLTGVQYVRSHNEVITASALFDVTQNVNLADEGDMPVYRGAPVLMDRSATVNDLQERIARSVDIIDNGAGPIVVDIQNDYVRNAQTISFDKQNKQALWKLRQWFHARKGKQVSFWLPSWNKDLFIVEDVGASVSAITVQAIGYPLYYGVKDIMLRLRDGTLLFRRVLSGATDIDGNETLALDQSFGVSFAVADIEIACFVTHCRLDSDKITLNHSEFGRATVVVPVTETPE